MSDSEDAASAYPPRAGKVLIAAAQTRRLLVTNKADKHKQDAPCISSIGGHRISVHEHETIVNDETEQIEFSSSEEKVDKQVREHERAVAQEAAKAASDSSKDTVNLMSSPKYSRINVMSQDQRDQHEQNQSDHHGRQNHNR
ncbi:hypothetical protein EV178_006129 [Coemansia sp. RSA 1646]|nr:hypothetical protein EV178_006129 [Coemansia sp. RSA 1646]